MWTQQQERLGQINRVAVKHMSPRVTQTAGVCCMMQGAQKHTSPRVTQTVGVCCMTQGAQKHTRHHV